MNEIDELKKVMESVIQVMDIAVQKQHENTVKTIDALMLFSTKLHILEKRIDEALAKMGGKE